MHKQNVESGERSNGKNKEEHFYYMPSARGLIKTVKNHSKKILIITVVIIISIYYLLISYSAVGTPREFFRSSISKFNSEYEDGKNAQESTTFGEEEILGMTTKKHISTIDTASSKYYERLRTKKLEEDEENPLSSNEAQGTTSAIAVTQTTKLPEIETESITATKDDHMETTRTKENTTPTTEEAESFETKRCKVPQIDPWDEAIMPFVRRPEAFSCGPPPPMTHLVPSCSTAESEATSETGEEPCPDWPPPPPLVAINSSLVVEWANASLGGMKCCAAPITRDEPHSEEDLGTDNRFRIGKCIPFNDTISTTSDFTMVNCSQDDQSMYIGMHAHVVPTEETLKKVEAAAANGANRPPSIFLLTIDSSSRLNFFRAMPKLRAVLEEAGAVDMTSYNKVGENTLPNLLPLLGGISLDDANGDVNSTTRPNGYGCWPNKKYTFDTCPLLFRNFSTEGYVTMYTEDEPTQGTFHYYKPGFRYQPTDHYSRHYFMFGEEHAEKYEMSNAYWCYAHTFTHRLMIDYAKSFVETYSTRVPYFALTFFVGIGHALASNIELADEEIAEFARWVITSADEDTKKGGSGLFFAAFSDHGMRWGPLRESPAGWMEERLPFLYIRPPLTKEALARRTWGSSGSSQDSEAEGKALDLSGIIKSLYPHLLTNRDRLITPYDFHFTLAAFLKNRTSVMNSTCEKCYDILHEIVPLSRTCEDAKIPDQYCTCVDEKKASVDDTEVKEASRAAVQHLNDVLEEETKCAKLKLDKILSANYRTLSSDKDDEKNGIRMLDISIVTIPGKAVFEVDTVFNNESIKIQPYPARLNVYGNQSWCTNDWKLKPYCFCTEAG
ncbi:uncharacterized protein LOC124168914 [Ischnura elegans]|uniref:uncharacterized protein LOC124168914 n=1 Tax=Ischnura elegans TaxID=197161 RepID=UPI001ED89AB2|nr:uncharacterized protein LOC124168914 [Ischnura elegans]